MRNHRTRKPYRLASRCRVAGNERSPRRRSSKAAAYPRPVARKEHLMWSAGGMVLRCGAEADTVCTKGTGYRTNRARTQRNVWPDVFLVRMASAGVVLGAGRCACEEPCVCGDIGQPRAFHRTRRPGSGPAGGARIFLITYQAHLATAGRRKLGFRRPRNHVSGRLAVDSRSPTSSRGRLRFVSAAQMSLVRNQENFSGRCPICFETISGEVLSGRWRPLG